MVHLGSGGLQFKLLFITNIFKLSQVISDLKLSRRQVFIAQAAEATTRTRNGHDWTKVVWLHSIPGSPHPQDDVWAVASLLNTPAKLVWFIEFGITGPNQDLYWYQKVIEHCFWGSLVRYLPSRMKDCAREATLSIAAGSLFCLPWRSCSSSCCPGAWPGSRVVDLVQHNNRRQTGLNWKKKCL